LKRLDLAYNRISDVGLGHLLASKHLGQVRSLDLANNQIGEGARDLAGASFARQLTALRLAGNPVRPETRRLVEAALGPVVSFRE
jgi:hypothetical protein